MKRTLPTLLIAGLAGSLTASDNPTADKSKYHLFNPTPASLMRPMSTDRPDLTESPYTVDAGHFQIEMDLVNYSFDRYNVDRVNNRVETYAIAPVNFKVGLLNNVDLQVVIEPYIHVRENNRTLGTVSKNSGFGDITTRLKVNLWGNDEGPFAVGLMPFVKIPTNTDGVGNNSVEGGVIFPFAADLPYGFGMGLMTEVDFVRDEDGSGHHAELVNSITFGRDIVGNLAGYVEFFTAYNTEGSADWVGVLGVGFTYGVTENIQLDGGINFGLTRAADDYNPFVGISWRF